MELGATNVEAGRKTGAEVGLGVLAAETGAAEEITGKEWKVGVTERSLFCHTLSCLVGSCALSIALLVCSSTVGWEQLEEGWEEDSTLVAKVGSEGDGASPLTGVQVEGGFAPHRPKYR